MQKEFLLSLIAGVLVLLFVVGTNRKPQSVEEHQQAALPPKYVKVFLATVVATFVLLLLVKQASSDGQKPRAGKPGRAAMNAEQRMLDTVLSNIDLAEPGF